MRPTKENLGSCKLVNSQISYRARRQLSSEKLEWRVNTDPEVTQQQPGKTAPHTHQWWDKLALEQKLLQTNSKSQKKMQNMYITCKEVTIKLTDFSLQNQKTKENGASEKQTFKLKICIQLGQYLRARTK